jgi:hypothetical protein
LIIQQQCSIDSAELAMHIRNKEEQSFMMEYIFFDASLRERFVEEAAKLNVPCELHDDSMGMVVMVPDDLSDSLHELLEAHYEQLENEQSQLLSQTEGGFKSLAGFSLVLPDGTTTTVPLQPDVANRLLASFTIDEIQSLFSTIASCALEPEQKHLCKILRNQ